jgi:hypothetical protein
MVIPDELKDAKSQFVSLKRQSIMTCRFWNNCKTLFGKTYIGLTTFFDDKANQKQTGNEAGFCLKN